MQPEAFSKHLSYITEVLRDLEVNDTLNIGWLRTTRRKM
jgi:hypothetical protein